MYIHFCLKTHFSIQELGLISDTSAQHWLSGNVCGYIDWWKCLGCIFNNAQSSRSFHKRICSVWTETWWYITADEKIFLIVLQCNIIFSSCNLNVFMIWKEIIGEMCVVRPTSKICKDLRTDNLRPALDLKSSYCILRHGHTSNFVVVQIIHFNRTFMCTVFNILPSGGGFNAQKLFHVKFNFCEL